MALPVDLTAVAAFMDDSGLGVGPLEDVRPLGGGTQNVMLRFTRAGVDYVLRRGPEHLRPRSNDVMLRETRVLTALADTDVPHPRLVATCADPDVLGGAVFYLMEPVTGFNASLELPEPHASDPALRHAMGLSLVDALARLGAVDHVAVGLADLGKPEGFLERQVPRWLAELASYDVFEGYPGPDIGDVDGVARWLGERVPTRWQPGLLHGDYHAANVMFSRTGAEVAAIVDWEMCTIGDPLLDLGWLAATWQLTGAPDEFAGVLTRAGGLPTSAELVDRYAMQSTRDVTAVDWYTVLACFKLGIILEGSHARMHAGQATPEIGERLHTTTLRLFERAEEIVDGAR